MELLITAYVLKIYFNLDNNDYYIEAVTHAKCLVSNKAVK